MYNKPVDVHGFVLRATMKATDELSIFLGRPKHILKNALLTRMPKNEYAYQDDEDVGAIQVETDGTDV